MACDRFLTTARFTALPPDHTHVSVSSPLSCCLHLPSCCTDGCAWAVLEWWSSKTWLHQTELLSLD